MQKLSSALGRPAAWFEFESGENGGLPQPGLDESANVTRIDKVRKGARVIDDSGPADPQTLSDAALRMGRAFDSLRPHEQKTIRNLITFYLDTRPPSGIEDRRKSPCGSTITQLIDGLTARRR